MLNFLIEYLAILMFVALAAGLFTGFPVAFLLGGIAVVFGTLGWMAGVFSPIEFFNFVPRVWSGSADNIILVAVPCFIYMGVMLDRSGVALKLLNTLQYYMRAVPGGLALAVTILATILAATTGIIGASVTMMALLALPPMLKRGYQTELAVGTIAASSCLGILIPPSIMLVIMADMMSISVGKLFMGALLPGLILSALYMVYVVGISFLRPGVAPATQTLNDVSGKPPARDVVIGFLAPLALILMVLGSIFGGLATPTEASAIGAFGATVLAFLNGMLDKKSFADAVDRTAVTVGMIFGIIIGATAFSYVFRSLGGEHLIVEAIGAFEYGPWPILVALMLAIFLLGFFFDWLEITLIILPIFSVVIKNLDFGGHVQSGYNLYWFAILVAVNLQTSFLSPPFGYSLFYLKAVAPEGVRTAHIYRGIIPFIVLQLIGLTLITVFPALVTWLPSLMSR